MEKNFHYHGTYTAAVMASFPPDEALIIARAAQYVDECNGETVQGYGTIFFSNMLDILPGRNQEIRTILDIWPVFHFLPGDFPRISDYVNSQLLADPRDHVRLAPQLICGTESTMTRAIVEGARDAYLSAPGAVQGLQRIGITMHVLADTFAHQDFAGIPLSLINEVSNVLQADPGESLHRELYVYSPAGSKTSFGYLGHGRMGSLPDQPGEIFTYDAAWRGNLGGGSIMRCNPVEFYCAYLQMTEAMEYILNRRSQFSNAVDRALLQDPQRSQWPVSSCFLEALEKAGSDKGFPDPWYAVIGAVKPAPKYAPYSPRKEPALYQAFLAAAQDHRNLVKDLCTPLQQYRELFPLAAESDTDL